ncbi:hypothetical protein GCM10009714_34740 [Microlunatus capsulatus]
MVTVVPAAARSTRTRKVTAVAAFTATLPPAVALAPAPSRARTSRSAATYSATSSPAASVFGVVEAFGPLTTVVLSGT